MGTTQTEKRPRGRPKKIKVEDNPSVVNEKTNTLQMTKKNETKQPITINQVQGSLVDLFSRAMKDHPFNFINEANRYNPFLQNQRLKMIDSYPAVYSPETIAEFLKNPQWHEGELRSASAALSASQYLYYKILREAADIPLFKTMIVPPVLEEHQYASEEFKKEEAFVEEWLDRFDVVNTGKRVQLETKRDGKSTYLFRQSVETKNNVSRVCYVAWQKLPLRWTKLTAIGEHGYIASFDFLIFMHPEFSPLQYPDYIQQIWKDLLEKKTIFKNAEGQMEINCQALCHYQYHDSKRGYSLRGTLERNAETQSYMYWVQLPQDVCFTFASDSSNSWAAPDTIGLFPALQELTDYSTLAGLVASTPLTSVLTGEAEACPGAQPGQDQFVLSPHTMLAFQNTFNSMASSNIQAFLAPFKNLKLQSLPNIPNGSDIKTKATQNFVATAAEGGLIAATDKPSVAMVKGAQQQAASQYDFVTKQIQAVLNDNLRRHAGLKYEWKIVLWGDVFSFNETVRMLKEQVQGGASFLLPRLASAYDLSMRQVRGIGAYLEANKIYDHLKPLQWSTSQQGFNKTNSTDVSDKAPGRPALDDSEVENDNTAASKDAGNDTGEMRHFIEQGVCVLCGSPLEDGHIFCENCEYEMGIENE